MTHTRVPASFERRQATAKLAIATRYQRDNPEAAAAARRTYEAAFLRDTIAELGGRLPADARAELVALLARSGGAPVRKRGGRR